ncbi:MAG: hypothetical protein CL862_07215 [Cyanobium sp. NAT70]|nr:hypothetical protein [Cyanobium sp. NAT70]|tara:strand:+ start:296 stop:1114 length:819 start_codon:yes stop_codon:yes gene_type:complete
MHPTGPLTAHWFGPLGASAWRNHQGIWTSRRLRKGHGAIPSGRYQPTRFISALKALMKTKSLARLDVRTALAFIIGPLLFAIGSGLQLSNPEAPAAAGLLAIGSVFFTAGGWWQLRQAQQVMHHLPDQMNGWLWCGLLCAITQSLGTLLFNIDTFSVWIQPNLDGTAWLLLVVMTNLMGSILFLISAYFGLVEIGHGHLLSFEPDHFGWWINLFNTIGCLWFMQSALASLPSNPAKAMVINSTMATQTTLLGALAFTLVGLISLAECSEDEG